MSSFPTIDVSIFPFVSLEDIGFDILPEVEALIRNDMRTIVPVRMLLPYWGRLALTHASHSYPTEGLGTSSTSKETC
jgi:hypothetical protein